MYMVGDSGGANKPLRVQVDNVNDFVENADRIFIGDGACSLIMGTANSGFTPNNSYIAMLHGGNIQMGAGAGSNEHLIIDTSGHILPGVTNTQDLGSSSKRWANIYTSDLHLKNEVGDWTVVEGEEELFLHNNKTGKKYAIMMREIE